MGGNESLGWVGGGGGGGGCALIIVALLNVSVHLAINRRSYLACLKSQTCSLMTSPGGGLSLYGRAQTGLAPPSRCQVSE